MGRIYDNVRRILEELPPHVTLVAATKGRTPEEVEEAISAGVRVIGENYVQEAERKKAVVKSDAEWHMIGRLQRNKVKKAVKLFDVIQTVDSFKLAREIDRRAGDAGKVMPVMIEVNTGREVQKGGVMPEDAMALVEEISSLKNVEVIGLMTMGPYVENPEDIRPYFRLAREIFDKIRSLDLPNVDMRYLSMGMSSTYRVAVEEGANMVRIGTAIFGPRR